MTFVWIQDGQSWRLTYRRPGDGYDHQDWFATRDEAVSEAHRIMAWYLPAFEGEYLSLSF